MRKCFDWIIEKIYKDGANRFFLKFIFSKMLYSISKLWLGVFLCQITSSKALREALNFSLRCFSLVSKLMPWFQQFFQNLIHATSLNCGQSSRCWVSIHSRSGFSLFKYTSIECGWRSYSLSNGSTKLGTVFDCVKILVTLMKDSRKRFKLSDNRSLVFFSFLLHETPHWSWTTQDEQ